MSCRQSKNAIRSKRIAAVRRGVGDFEAGRWRRRPACARCRAVSIDVGVVVDSRRTSTSGTPSPSGSCSRRGRSRHRRRVPPRSQLLDRRRPAPAATRPAGWRCSWRGRSARCRGTGRVMLAPFHALAGPEILERAVARRETGRARSSRRRARRPGRSGSARHSACSGVSENCLRARRRTPRNRRRPGWTAIRARSVRWCRSSPPSSRGRHRSGRERPVQPEFVADRHEHRADRRAEVADGFAEECVEDDASFNWHELLLDQCMSAADRPGVTGGMFSGGTSRETPPSSAFLASGESDSSGSWPSALTVRRNCSR